VSTVLGFVYVLVVVFVGALLAGILVSIAFSASACVIVSPVIQCFSISRDAVGVTLAGMKMWALPAFIAALFVAAIGRIRGNVAWWNVLIVAPASYLVLAMLFPDSIDRYMWTEFLVFSAILFICVQLSIFVGRLAGRLPI
jgi:hypothetical protein